MKLWVKPVEVAGILWLLETATKKADHTGGALNIRDLCNGAQGFAVFDETEPHVLIMAYALKAQGSTCWVVVASGGLEGCNLTATVMPAIEAQARAMGCTQLAVTTKRKGLIKKLSVHGFEPTAITLRKKIA